MREAIAPRPTPGRFVVCLAVLLLPACGGDGTGPDRQRQPGLAITAASPGAGEAGVETGAVVTMTFDRDVDPATVTSQTVRVLAGGTALAASIGYDSATRTATAVAPLLPGETYEVEVTTGVRTSASLGLDVAERWSFTTRPWVAVSLDDIGFYPSLTIDGDGRLHVAYWRGGSLGYATCEGACAAAADWARVSLEVGGAVYGDASVAVDGSGQVHVAYYDHAKQALGYATCPASCTTDLGWDTATVAEVLYTPSGTTDYRDAFDLFTSIGVSASGSVHVSFWSYDLRQAICAADCLTPANWTTDFVDLDTSEGWSTSLLVEGSGRVHVAYRPYGEGTDPYANVSEELRYATCADFGSGTCGEGSLMGWPKRSVDPVGGRHASLAVDAAGGVHIGHYSRDGGLRYAACATGCLTAGAWQSVTVSPAAPLVSYTSLALDGNGRRHIVFEDDGQNLAYATCAADCVEASSWRTRKVHDAGDWVTLAVDENGRVHSVFIDGSLTYMH